MLTRLYLNNFRCFVNFEYRPSSRKQLILGRNGSGKSSLLDALLAIRQFAVNSDVDAFGILGQRTRWLKEPRQTYELDANLEGGAYTYKLSIEPFGVPEQTRVLSEIVLLDGRPIFEFINGEVQLYTDELEQYVAYPFDWHRSALNTIVPGKDNQKLIRFKSWLAGLFCFRIDPFSMYPRSEKEDYSPKVNLSNFASWYRHLLQTFPRENDGLLKSLREALDQFAYLKFETFGEDVRLLLAEFGEHNKSVKFYFRELSEGQRSLICLYTILHFVLERGQTVIVDEPENFISLRELQPWLMAVTDSVDENRGQMFIISHHPEFINQWAPDYGIQLIREGTGPVRIANFESDPESVLSPAELVARSWEHE